MITIKQAIENLSDAVTGSGKSLEQIGKSPIFEYLTKAGIKQEYFNSIWDKLTELHNPKVNNYSTSGFNNQKEIQKSNLSENSNKQPRKNVFGDIKKIAG